MAVDHQKVKRLFDRYQNAKLVVSCRKNEELGRKNTVGQKIQGQILNRLERVSRLIRHKICSILTLACLLLPIMPAQAAPTIVQGNVDKLNIRSGPGLTYNVVTQLSTPNRLNVVKEQDDWYQISLPDGTKGWIASWLVKPVSGGSVSVTAPAKSSSTTSNTSVSSASRSASSQSVTANFSPSASNRTTFIQSNVTQLNVRSAPNQTSAVMQKINPDKSYPLLQRDGQWVKIQLSPSQTGWVAGWLVKETSSSQNSALTASVVGKTRTLPTDAQVYSTPDLQSPTIGMIGKGDSITVEQELGGWQKITYDGQPGWITTNSALPAVNKPVPSGNSGNNASASVAKVNASNVNLRSQPTTNSSVVGKLGQGDTLTILSRQGEWLQVKTPKQQQGWVAGWLVAQSPSEGDHVPSASIPSETSPSSTTPQVTILNPETNVRSGPGTTHQIVGRVQTGERYPILSTEGEWYRIQLTDGTTGYIAGWLVNAEGEGTQNIVHGDALKNKLIVVDAGHGGEDGGAIGTSFSTKEKTINLEVALDLKEKLEAAGAKVIMTRSDDRRLTLQQRVDVAVNNKADLFVSVHHNTHPNPAMNGSIIFYYKEGESSKLAAMVQSEIVKSTNYADLHSRFGDYFVLRENPVVSILCEVGFMTNYEEELRLRSSNQQDLAAEGIYKGIARYFAAQSQQ